jgi:hypothetical protein
MDLATNLESVDVSGTCQRFLVGDVGASAIGLESGLVRPPRARGTSALSKRQIFYGLPASPQLLRRHAQRSVEFAGSVLPRNRRSQLYQSIVTVELSQLTNQFITYISPGDCHAVGKLERHSFRVSIEVTAGVVRK